MTISKRRAIERLRASSNIRPEKVDEALEEMEEVRGGCAILGPLVIDELRRRTSMSRSLLGEHRASLTTYIEL